MFDERQPDHPEYATTGIDSSAARPDAGAQASAEAGVDWEFIETGVIPLEPEPEGLSIEQRLGMAVLRLRLYRGLSQKKLERISGVDQTSISRLETTTSRGMSVRRLCRLLTALRAEEITFGPGPGTVPQSSWEDAMYGDMWERAGRVAEARVRRSLSRRRSA